MEHKEFDDIIRGKLNEFEADFNPQAWELFEDAQAIKESGTPELDNNAIDEVAFDRLHRLEVPYQAAHWQKMSQRLKEEFSLQYKIYRYKLIEISVVLLAIFTLINFWPSIGAFPIQFGGTPSIKKQTPTEQLEQHIQKTTVPVKKDNTILSIPSPRKETTGPIASNNVSATTNDQIVIQQVETSPPALITNRPSTIEVTPLIATKKIDKVYSDPYNLYNKWEHLATAQNLPTLNLLQSQFVEVDHSLPAIKKEKEKAMWRVGMFGSSNLVIAETPANFIDNLEIDGFSRNGIGYGGGISVGISKNRWEFELGMIYNAMKYAPSIFEVKNDSVGGVFEKKGLKIVELNLVSVPLNIRYNYLHNKKWRLFVLGGISAHVSVQNNYDISDDPADFGEEPPKSTAPTDLQGETTLRNIPLQFDSENLTKGLLEGGTFKENTYFSGNIGLGVEYFLNDKWSIFTQPTYFHSFSYLNGGLGPNKDRINSFNVLMGIKVNLID